ncbi:unnamed protein product [Brassica oleracea var. botrytis]|uniref:Auxin-responsive protein n=1 Tax=Brassica oleracea var. oleracea TaxID=109376 RepID=A0A0D3AFS2_BRAOL
MALVRGFLAAKKILGVSVAGSSKPTSAPKGFLRCTFVRTRRSRDTLCQSLYLNQPLFQALLSKAEEELGFNHSMVV